MNTDAVPHHWPSNAPTDFSAKVRDAFVRLSLRRRWHAGDIVCRQGETPASAVMLFEGRLRLVGYTPLGDEVLLRWLAPGEFIGFAAVIAEMPLAVNAVSVGGCETMHMPAAALHEMMSGDRELSLAISHVISRHACQMAELLLMQTGQSLGSRVLTVIRRLAAQKTVARREGAAVLKISQSDIARAAGASRQRVNIELHRLHELGYVRLGYREIALLDPPPLQE